jgi:hypothetical protein
MAIHSAARSDAQDKHDEGVITDFVDYSVAADPNSTPAR